MKENNYIESPKASGYRSLHRVYRYTSDKRTLTTAFRLRYRCARNCSTLGRLRLRRSAPSWAKALKASQGSDEWLRFFALMGSALALREGTALVPGTPTSQRELVSELRDHVRSLDVDNRLAGYGSALNVMEEPFVRGAEFFLLELVPSKHEVRVASYSRRELSAATEQYLQVERSLEGPGSEAVLVSVESLNQLRRAYPNYFLDTEVFLAAVRESIA